MMARVALLVGLVLFIIGILHSKGFQKEAISLNSPVGYAVAKKIEAPKEVPFVSALEYAQAFQATLSIEPEAKSVVAPPKPPKRMVTKRHIAKAKIKKSKLIARW